MQDAAALVDADEQQCEQQHSAGGHVHDSRGEQQATQQKADQGQFCGGHEHAVVQADEDVDAGSPRNDVCQPPGRRRFKSLALDDLGAAEAFVDLGAQLSVDSARARAEPPSDSTQPAEPPHQHQRRGNCEECQLPGEREGDADIDENVEKGRDPAVEQAEGHAGPVALHDQHVAESTRPLTEEELPARVYDGRVGVVLELGLVPRHEIRAQPRLHQQQDGAHGHRDEGGDERPLEGELESRRVEPCPQPANRLDVRGTGVDVRHELDHRHEQR